MNKYKTNGDSVLENRRLDLGNNTLRFCTDDGAQQQQLNKRLLKRLYSAQHFNISGHSATGRQILIRIDYCYITFHTFSVVIYRGINPQRIFFNYSGKIAEQFYK